MEEYKLFANAEYRLMELGWNLEPSELHRPGPAGAEAELGWKKSPTVFNLIRQAGRAGGFLKKRARHPPHLRW